MLLERLLTNERRRWVALGIVCLGQLMFVLDATIVNVALPAIQKDLHFSASSLTWVPNAYLIAFGSFLLLAGRLGDLAGRTRVFLAGLIIFTGASMLCGFSVNSGMLIGARFLQGLGAAVTASAILALIVIEFPEPADRARAMSAFTFVSVAGGSMGLLLGGVLTETLDWHWIFFVNLPIGAFAFFAGLRVLDRAPGLGLTRNIDWLGSLLVTTAAMAGIFGIIETDREGIGSPITITLLAGSALLLWAFFRWEARVADPILPMRVMKLRSLLIACGVRSLMVVGMFGSFFMGSLYLEKVHGYGPIATGAAFLPQTLTVAALSLGITARMVKRFGNRNVLLFGLSMLIAALVVLAFATGTDVHYMPLMLIGYLLLGLGAGSSFMTLMGLGLAEVPASEAGIAGGLMNVSVQIAGAVGLALLGTIAESRTGALRGHEAAADALVGGYKLGFFVAAGFVTVALLATLRFIRTPKTDEVTAPAGALSEA